MNDKGVRAEDSALDLAIAPRGSRPGELDKCGDRLTPEQIHLFGRIRDEGACICVTGAIGEAADPDAHGAFLNAKMAKGREIERTPDFERMRRIGRTTAMRSISGGHLALLASHADGLHHFYGLSPLGLTTLAKHESAWRARSARAAAARPKDAILPQA